MGPATTGPRDVTRYLTAAMALMRQTAVRRHSILVLMRQVKDVLGSSKNTTRNMTKSTNQVLFLFSFCCDFFSTALQCGPVFMS